MAAETHPAVTRAALTDEVRAVLGSATEARWLVEDAVGHGRDGVPAVTAARVRAQAARCKDGEPLQYVLGHWSFRSLDLVVDPRVLIPRPETEQVVEVALAELAAAMGERLEGIAVDLGTGSGAIALSLAVETRRAGRRVRVWATDTSPDALAVARANRDRVGMEDPAAAESVTLRRGAWWDALSPALAGCIDLVVANPPYVAEAEWPSLDAAVHREPRAALVAADGVDPSGGTDAHGRVPGFADVATVLTGAVRWLAPGGSVVVELAPHQAEAAAGVARRSGLHDVRVCRDLSGRDRMVAARR
jgi:release factor glutamine methyltransferase